MKENKKDPIKKEDNNLRPYKMTKLESWPISVKVFIIKAWAAGAVFYFIFMSAAIFTKLTNPLDRWVLSGLVLILINEYLTNTLIKAMARKDEVMNEHAMFINNKWSLIFNIIYLLIVLSLVILLGGFFINLGISLSKIFMPGEDATWEPIMFGLLFYSVDTILIKSKNKIVSLLRRDNKNEI